MHETVGSTFRTGETWFAQCRSQMRSVQQPHLITPPRHKSWQRMPVCHVTALQCGRGHLSCFAALWQQVITSVLQMTIGQYWDSVAVVTVKQITALVTAKAWRRALMLPWKQPCLWNQKEFFCIVWRCLSCAKYPHKCFGQWKKTYGEENSLIWSKNVNRSSVCE